MKKFIAGLALLGLAGVAQAELTSSVYEGLRKGSKLDKHSAEMYIGGVGKGYLQANASLSLAKQPLLFCFDGDYTTKQFAELADKQLKVMHKQFPGDNAIPMEIALLLKLQEMHPCK